MNNELNSLKKAIAELNEKIAIIESKKEDSIIKIKNILENNIEEKTNNLKTEILVELSIYEKNKKELLNLNLELFGNKIKYRDILYQKNVTKIDNLNQSFADNDKVKTILRDLEYLKTGLQYLRNDNDNLDKEIVDYEEKNNEKNKKMKDNEENISNLIKQKKAKGWKIICLNIITFGIFRYYRNKKIAEKINLSKEAIKDLNKEITNNIENIQRLKNKKLNIFKKITNWQCNLLDEYILNIEEFYKKVIKREDSEDSDFIDSSNSISVYNKSESCSDLSNESRSSCL